MILVDTSIWIDHLRARDELLCTLLADGKVLGHPFVTGTGSVSDRIESRILVRRSRDGTGSWHRLPIRRKRISDALPV